MQVELSQIDETLGGSWAVVNANHIYEMKAQTRKAGGTEVEVEQGPYPLSALKSG